MQTIKTCEFAGLELIEGVYPAKAHVPEHAHEQAVFCIGLTGVCSEVLGGKVRRYEPSTVAFLPAHQCHSLAFPCADTRAFSIDVAGCWIERARELSLQLDDSVHARGGVLSALMMRIYEEFRQLDTASPLAIQGLTMEMLAAVSRSHSHASVRRRPRRLAWALEFLRERFTEQVTLAQVAAAAGLHPVYLAREFRRFHGCTIGEFIRRLRIERACRQLSASDEPLATIAANAGFADQSHFSRTFKRLVGMTPAHYRASFAARRSPVN
ncbi:MAG TPA: AraC family transcriptional regulator [Steroidobacteraceae bacterium]|nr:AraC family transcriptional regulator [Steroidobacteraceae bacterium]